jgi:hypothetical protein
MTDAHDVRVASQGVELLRLLLERQIRALVRYEWAPLDTLPPAAPGWSHFRLAPGPLVVTLDSGVELAFASAPAQASVQVWLERDAQGGRADRAPLADRAGLYPLRADDAGHSDAFIGGLLGQRVVGVQVLQRQAAGVKLQAQPRDAGVLWTLDGGQRLLIGHGLHDGSDDLAVLEPGQIDVTIQPQLAPRLVLGRSAS